MRTFIAFLLVLASAEFIKGYINTTDYPQTATNPSEPIATNFTSNDTEPETARNETSNATAFELIMSANSEIGKCLVGIHKSF
jgi:hypothetical protein